MQFASKKVCWKNNRVFQILAISPHLFGTLCSFSKRPFLKQLESHVSADTLQLKFPGMMFFSPILGIENFFWKVLKFFA